ncbi:3-phosphoserine/phosphohydroxythreonine transaminase [Legionella geestiana]|nr:3-phosphoserine/phosphohydroxythreonine transaminase [Legionella geestiana]QDQ41040.1 3-phosphoserine/phosphohydroxythreonine transaminase [Legionella geestiana]
MRRMLNLQTRFNFGAGPGMLPPEVIQEAAAELPECRYADMSILEVGHRTDAFQALLKETVDDCRRLLGVPDNYHILFLGGAARTQFAACALNFFTGKLRAAYLVSGLWSSMAFAEASRLSNAYCLASTEPQGFLDIPDVSSLTLEDNTGFIYCTPNETVNGVALSTLPACEDLPLVADMTSCLFATEVDIQRFGLIFAGAQKNLGPAGMTIVIVRDDLLACEPSPMLPAMMDYRVHVRSAGLYATPPVFNIWMAAKMLKWMEKEGGVKALAARNREKSQRLYSFIDQQDFYKTRIQKRARSVLNVCFDVPEAKQLEPFLKGASEHGLLALRGHRAVGGLRASLYNPMPIAGVDALIEYMNLFCGSMS